MEKEGSPQVGRPLGGSAGYPECAKASNESVIVHMFKLNFFNTSEFTFSKMLGDPDKLAANLRNYMAGFSSKARKIIEKFKFEEEIEKLDEANRLFEVVKQLGAVDLHPKVIPNIAMGYLFEDLVRRFNEQANEGPLHSSGSDQADGESSVHQRRPRLS